MSNFVVLQTPAAVATSFLPSLKSFSVPRLHDSAPSSSLAIRNERRTTKSLYREIVLTGIPFRRAHSPFQVAAGRCSDSVDDSSTTSGIEWKDGDDSEAPLTWDDSSPATQQEGIVFSFSRAPLQALSKDAAMGLVLREAAGTGWTTGSGLEGPTGWTTDSGLEGPADPASKEELKFPNLSKSPRRKMRVAFTCNVCGERTIRAINPLAYTDGTVFVQCKGCDVFHKLVDNLNLFHEMRGKIYRGYDIPWYANDQPYDFSQGQYPLM